MKVEEKKPEAAKVEEKKKDLVDAPKAATEAKTAESGKVEEKNPEAAKVEEKKMDEAPKAVAEVKPAE